MFREPKRSGSAFSMVELLVSLVIISALVAIVSPVVVGLVERAREQQQRRTLVSLNEALDFYRTFGGDISVLTEGADVGNVIDRLKTEILHRGMDMQFLSDSDQIDLSRLAAIGNGHRYRFYLYGEYISEEFGYDDDAADYFARAEALGGNFDNYAINNSYTEHYVKGAISNFVETLKTKGVWSKISEAYLMCGVSFGGVLAKLKYVSDPTLANVAFGASDYKAAGVGAGLKSDGTTSYLMTGYTPLNSTGSFSLYAQQGNSFTNNKWFFISEDVAGNRLGMLQLPGQIRPQWGENGYNLNEQNVSFPAYIIGTRTDASNLETFVNGSSVGTGSWAYSGMPNMELVIFGGHPSSGPEPESDARLTFFHVGDVLSATESADLWGAVNSLMGALGVSSYNDAGVAVYDSDAADYFARAEALGGSFDRTAENVNYTEDYVKLAISDLVKECKERGVWNKLEEVYLFTGVSFSGLTAKLKAASSSYKTLTNVGFAGTDYTPAGTYSGLKGDNSSYFLTSYWDTKNTNYGQSAYVRDWGSADFAYTSTVQNLYSNDRLGMSNRDSNTVVRFYSDTTYGGPETAVAAGMFTGSIGYGYSQIYYNGLLAENVAVGTRSPTGFEFPVFCYYSGSVYNTAKSQKMNMVAHHSGFSAYDAYYFSEAVNRFMAKMGCNVYENGAATVADVVEPNIPDIDLTSLTTWHNFDDALDSHHIYDLTLNGTPTFSGGYLATNPTDGDVFMSQTSGWPTSGGTVDRSLVVRLRLHGTPSDNVIVQRVGRDGIIWESDGTLTCSVGSWVGYGLSTPVLATDTWYHIVVVRDGPTGDQRLYVDGVLVASGNCGNALNSSGGWELGGSNGTPYGEIDYSNFSLWLRELGEDEIIQLYNNGNDIGYGEL